MQDIKSTTETNGPASLAILMAMQIRRYGAVIGHGTGGKYIPIMARLAEARRWSKRRQTCLPSPDLTAIHNEGWLEDPSTFTQRTTGRSYDILRRVSYES